MSAFVFTKISVGSELANDLVGLDLLMSDMCGDGRRRGDGESKTAFRKRAYKAWVQLHEFERVDYINKAIRYVNLLPVQLFLMKR